MSNNITPQQALAALKEYYNGTELEELAFIIGIPYGSLEGNSPAARALALVKYSQRHGKYDQLIQEIAARPEVNWDIPAASSSESTPNNTQDQGGNTYIVQGDLFQGDNIGQEKVGGDKISVADISNSSGIAIGKDASAQVTNETVAPKQETSQQPTTQINIQGNVTGSAIGGGNVTAENIAGGNITIGSKEEFQSQLAALEALIQEAIANNEIPADEVEDVQDDLSDAAKEAAKKTPKANRLTPRLQYLQGVLNKSAEVATAAGKMGSAVLKAAPIVAGLVKAASILF